MPSIDLIRVMRGLRQLPIVSHDPKHIFGVFAVTKQSQSTSQKRPKRPAAKQTIKRECRTQGTTLVWPSGVCKRYGISTVTRWRWERQKKLPPRDVFINGEAVGWRPETLDSAARGA
jgi:predicted DNA-binding transcriptional regulator AlpA